MITPPSSPADDALDRDGGWQSSRPSSRFTLVRRWGVHTVAQLHALRERVDDEISTCTPDTDRGLDRVAQEMVLVTSELVTNALHHGRAPTVVQLLRDGTRFVVTVADGDPGAPRIAGARPPGEGGFGLRIVRRLSCDLGWYRVGAGKVVWAEVGP